MNNEQINIEQIHQEAMIFAQEAFVAENKGEKEIAFSLYKKAFELEKQAANYFQIDANNELTRAVLYRSAAALAINCKKYREANDLISEGLKASPPAIIAEELNDLYKKLPQNKLFYGDNLEVLRKYIKEESIDLCYIDPPFNSNRNYNQIYNNVGKEDTASVRAFTDTWTWGQMANEGFEEILNNATGNYTKQSIDLIRGMDIILGKGSLLAYLVSMTQRINEIHRVLKKTGSFYLHCDPTASHYLKLVLDSIFCARGGNYQNEIKWNRSFQHNLASKRFDNVIDVIFYYTKSNEYTFNKVYDKLTTMELKKKFPLTEKETGRKFNHQKLEKNSNHQSKDETRIIQGKQVSTNLGWVWTQKTFDERLAKNPYLIYWTNTGRPRYKIYEDEYEGRLLTNDWNDIKGLTSQAAEALGYPTQKPETLLERIIKTSSNEGEVVLDAYCGCGTTIAVAERLNRSWIGMDITYQSISLILKRLEDTFGQSFIKEVADKNAKQITHKARVELNGVPQDFASAVALANKQDDRLRKEFEKWFVLAYSNNRAVINEKKGGDGGIDGTAFMMDRD
jgi:DNA modification methylase